MPYYSFVFAHIKYYVIQNLYVDRILIPTQLILDISSTNHHMIQRYLVHRKFFENLINNQQMFDLQ